jgi:hypothetical protein
MRRKCSGGARLQASPIPKICQIQPQKDIGVINGFKPVRLFEGGCQLCQKQVGADANATPHPFTNFFPESSFYFLPDRNKASVIQGHGIRKINHRFINGFGGDVRGVIPKDLAKLHMHCPVFRRIRRLHNHSRVEEPGIPNSHAGFNAVLFCLNGWRHHAPVGAVVGGNDNRFAPKQGIGLLFNGGKQELRSTCMHDGWLQLRGSGIRMTTAYCSQIMYERIMNLLRSGEKVKDYNNLLLISYR